MRWVIFMLTAFSFAVACQTSVSPDEGRYSCETMADCGKGYECRFQFDGAARCFALGECVDTEACNSIDDNCDGRVDETFSLTDDSLNCGKCGQACAVGLQRVAGSCDAGGI